MQGLQFPQLAMLVPGRVDAATLDQLDLTLNVLEQHYRTAYRQAERNKEALINRMTATPELRKAYFDLLDRNRNESLADFVTNKNDVNMITEYQGELVQKSDPIYVRPVDGGFFAAQFYAPVKRFFGHAIATLWANMMVLWGMTLLMAMALKLDFFPRLVARFERRQRPA